MTKWAWLVVLAGLGACNGTTTKTDSGSGETGDTTDTFVPPPTNEERVAIIVGLTGDVTAGETVYLNHCAACHGADGTGIATGAADLTVRLPMLTDEQVALTILEGKGNMDAYDTTLSDEQIANVMAYIRASFASAGGTGI